MAQCTEVASMSTRLLKSHPITAADSLRFDAEADRNDPNGCNIRQSALNGGKRSGGCYIHGKVYAHRPRCVNPDHLKIGAISENTRDM